jgi:hypothetical protein
VGKRVPCFTKTLFQEISASADYRLNYHFGSRGIMQGELFHSPLANADGTNHPVIKRNHVVKHDAVNSNQAAGNETHPTVNKTQTLLAKFMTL